MVLHSSIHIDVAAVLSLVSHQTCVSRVSFHTRRASLGVSVFVWHIVLSFVELVSLAAAVLSRA